MKKILALCLSLTLLLGGCGFDFLGYLDEAYGYYDTVAYEDMAYTRPDLVAFENDLTAGCSAIQNAGTLQEVLNVVYAFNDAYNAFYTNLSLANIRYSADLTSTYWEEEYNYCLENSAAVDAGLDTLYRTLASCAFREDLETDEYFGPDYFDAYEGESLYDPHFLSLLEKEAELISRYYTLSEESAREEYYSEAYFSAYAPEGIALFVELVRVRQELAAYVGYSSYPEFAYDYYYARDYTPDTALAYLDQISEYLYPVYTAQSEADPTGDVAQFCPEFETLAYVRKAANAMGGDIKDAFGLLEEAGLYDIGYGENKYDSSFELYLWSYWEPFIFMCPYLDQSDKLTFAHEFGHFANDYMCGGSAAGIDVAEVHSQAFEYLSLIYGEAEDSLVRYKMYDSLCVYMESAAYSLFEHQVYSLTGSDLTEENVLALYERIGTQFGFDSWGWDSRDLIAIPHFYTDPMYMISYVVSNDLAMQLYRMEQNKPGEGLALYRQCLESEDSYLLAFAQLYGLESPFADTRLPQVRDTFTQLLAPKT